MRLLLRLICIAVANINLRPIRQDPSFAAQGAESYFEHVRKDAIKEVSPKLDRSKLDKASKKEVLVRAKKLFKGSAWLPEPLRVSAPAPSAAAAPIAAE